jgi:hypothetical protein
VVASALNIIAGVLALVALKPMRIRAMSNEGVTALTPRTK